MLGVGQKELQGLFHPSHMPRDSGNETIKALECDILLKLDCFPKLSLTPQLHDCVNTYILHDECIHEYENLYHNSSTTSKLSINLDYHSGQERLLDYKYCQRLMDIIICTLHCRKIMFMKNTKPVATTLS